MCIHVAVGGFKARPAVAFSGFIQAETTFGKLLCFLVVNFEFCWCIFFLGSNINGLHIPVVGDAAELSPAVSATMIDNDHCFVFQRFVDVMHRRFFTIIQVICCDVDATETRSIILGLDLPQKICNGDAHLILFLECRLILSPGLC